MPRPILAAAAAAVAAAPALLVVSVLAAPVPALAADAAAPAAMPGLFVLPVKSDRWGGSSLGAGEPRLLEARIVTALARGGRVRAVGARDIPADARAGLPRDLATCVTPACLETLGHATRAERVLALELLEEDAGPVLFATLYAVADGDVLDRRELPQPATAATRVWATEVARWASGAPPPAPPAPPPSLTVELSTDQAGRPEAQALRLALLDRLQARAWPLLAPPWGTRAKAARTHRAVITVENVAISDRVHHVHRYRHGVLVARLAVVDARTGGVVWTRRESADFAARSAEVGNQQVVDALVADVASRFDYELQDNALERLMRGDP